MSYIKATNAKEQEYFDFLEDLRKSGDTNMFGASPYLQAAFGLGKDEAINVLVDWMDAHKDKSRISDKPVSKTKTTVEIVTEAHVEREERQ